MAQSFDPKSLKSAVDALSAGGTDLNKIYSELDDRIKDISKNLTDQEKKQQTITALSEFQTKLTDLINDHKKASVVYDTNSFEIEKRRIETQETLLNIQKSTIDEALANNTLGIEEKRILEQKRKELTAESFLLKGNLKFAEQQKNVGQNIEDIYKNINAELKQGNNNLKESEGSLQKIAGFVAAVAGKKFFEDLKIPKDTQSLLSSVYELFKSIDSAATGIRKKFGLFREDAAYVEKNIRQLVIDLGEFGASADDIKKTMSSIGSTFNYIDTLDTSIVKDITILSKQMGIAADQSAAFLKTIGGIKGESGLSNKNMISFAGAAAAAYGVGLDDVMKDVADAGEEARMYAGKNAEEMVRAAAQARQMGTSLDNMARTAKGLLDFESSIQSELKASALIGKNINFNEARRLAFQGKVVEANKLILDQAKKIKFNQLNPIAQEAFAKAAGKTVKELQDMLEAESRMKSALTSNNKEVREAAQKQLEKQNLLKTNSKYAQQEYEKNLLNKQNQERIVILQNRLNAALQKIMLPVLESITAAMEDLVKLTDGFDFIKLINGLSDVNVLATMLKNNFLQKMKVVKDFLTFPAKAIKAIFESTIKITEVLKNKIKFLGDTFNLIKGYLVNFELLAKEKILNIGKYFTKILTELKITKIPLVDDFIKIISNLKSLNIVSKITENFNKVKNIVKSLFDAIKPLKDIFKPIMEGIKDLFKLAPALEGLAKFGFLTKILGKIPLIGNIISAIQFLYESYKNVMEVINNPNLTGWEKILGVISGLGKAAYTTLLETFVDIGKWIGENLLGPVYDKIFDIGFGIYDGIVAIKDKIVNVISDTFSSAWNAIRDWLGFSPSVLGLRIVDGIKSVVDMLFDVITYPFKKAFELIKSAVTEVGSVFKDIFSSAFNFIVKGLELVWEKIKGIGSFISEMFSKSFNFIAKIFTSNEETKSTAAATGKETVVANNDLLINTIVNTNKNIVDRLDKLTSLMASGQIAVYIDGQRANQILASTGVKFGSFGQATTN